MLAEPTAAVLSNVIECRAGSDSNVNKLCTGLLVLVAGEVAGTNLGTLGGTQLW